MSLGRPTLTDVTDPAPDSATAVAPGSALPGWLAIALVFGTSAAVLVLEILAGRLLAPYVGVSLETFTGIIGTILAGIAVGAWAGGLMADQLNPRRLLPLLLAAGGALAIATVPIVRALGDATGGGGGMSILVLTAFGFLPSATVLSAIPPAVVKLQLQDLASTGTVVGRLSAWGTAGALFGTFFTGFVLVSAAAVTTLIYVVGALLIASGLALGVRTRLVRATEMLSLVGLAVVSVGGATALGTPCDTQTAYYCLSVVESDEVDSGRMLVLDDLRHSYVDLDDPTVLEFWYVRRLIDAIEVQTTGTIEAVHLGGGAFTVPRYLRVIRPGSSHIILEIDGDLVTAVETEMDFDRADDVEILVGDGRLTMRTLEFDSADVVIADVFGGRAVPFHLATEEFIVDVKRVLRPDGIYVANIIDGPEERFLRAEVATISEVFDHVAVVRSEPLVRGRGGNAAVIASDTPLNEDALAARLAADIDPSESAEDLADPDRIVGQLVTREWLDDYVDGAGILTDDFAPVDQLLANS